MSLVFYPPSSSTPVEVPLRYTAELLAKLPAGEVFASGLRLSPFSCHLPDGSLAPVYMRWAAVRGQIADWALYYGLGLPASCCSILEPEFTIEYWSVDTVARIGNKLYDAETAVALVGGDSTLLAAYRY